MPHVRPRHLLRHPRGDHQPPSLLISAAVTRDRQHQVTGVTQLAQQPADPLGSDDLQLLHLLAHPIGHCSRVGADASFAQSRQICGQQPVGLLGIDQFDFTAEYPIDTEHISARHAALTLLPAASAAVPSKAHRVTGIPT
ncbi:MAG: hypothetical protein QM655_14930 [Nocardioidaceae bacterium]